jgi:hypothetical protein
MNRRVGKRVNCKVERGEVNIHLASANDDDPSILCPCPPSSERASMSSPVRHFPSALFLLPLLLVIHLIHLISLSLAKCRRTLFSRSRLPPPGSSTPSDSKGSQPLLPTRKRPKHIALLLVTPPLPTPTLSTRLPAPQLRRPLAEATPTPSSPSPWRGTGKGPREQGGEELKELERCLLECVRACAKWASESDEVETISFFDPNGSSLLSFLCA